MASGPVKIKVRALMGRRTNIMEGMRHLLKSKQVEKPAWFDVMERFPTPPRAPDPEPMETSAAETFAAELQYWKSRPLDAFPLFRFQVPFQEAFVPDAPDGESADTGAKDVPRTAALAALREAAALQAEQGPSLDVVAALTAVIRRRESLLRDAYRAAGLWPPPTFGELAKAALPSLPSTQVAKYSLPPASAGDARVVATRSFSLDVGPEGNLLISRPDGTLVYDEAVDRPTAGDEVDDPRNAGLESRNQGRGSGERGHTARAPPPKRATRPAR